MNPSNLPDVGGVYGNTLHYALTIAFMGSAVLIFLYFFWKGRLDMDEEPKMQMLLTDENIEDICEENTWKLPGNSGDSL